MAQCQGFRAQMVRLFLVITGIWQQDVAKILIVPGAPHNVYPARAITRLEGVTIYCTFFNNNSHPPRQFLCEKILLKKYLLGVMLIKQIFELVWLRPSSRTCTPITDYFHDKTIISKENHNSGLLYC